MNLWISYVSAAALSQCLYDRAVFEFEKDSGSELFICLSLREQMTERLPAASPEVIFLIHRLNHRLLSS